MPRLFIPRRTAPRLCRLVALACLAAVPAGCTTFPKLDAAVGPAARRAPYPKLAPLPELLQDSPASSPAPAADIAAGLDARGAALRAKAKRLYNTPVNGG